LVSPIVWWAFPPCPRPSCHRVSIPFLCNFWWSLPSSYGSGVPSRPLPALWDPQLVFFPSPTPLAVLVGCLCFCLARCSNPGCTFSAVAFNHRNRISAVMWWVSPPPHPLTIRPAHHNWRFPFVPFPWPGRFVLGKGWFYNVCCRALPVCAHPFCPPPPNITSTYFTRKEPLFP